MATIVPLVLVEWTLVITRATLVWSDLRLCMVSSMLTAIEAVVGVDAVIHLLDGYREERARGLPPREALGFTGALLGDSIFWACTTDAVGACSELADFARKAGQQSGKKLSAAQPTDLPAKTLRLASEFAC